MTNKIKQTMEEGINYFNGKYLLDLSWINNPKRLMEPIDFLKSHQHTLIDAVVETLLSLERDIYPEKEKGSPNRTSTKRKNRVNCGFNTAIKEAVKLLQESKE